jgi:putative copper resistance protein D
MPTDSSGTIAWLAAMLTLVLALSSSLAVYAHNLFWAHMIVHLLMIMVVPVLLVWAQPIRLAHTAGEPRACLSVSISAIPCSSSANQ